MGIELVVTQRRVVHVRSCARLQRTYNQAKLTAWDGSGRVTACRSCLIGKPGAWTAESKRIRHHPCSICRLGTTRPCKHTGVRTTVIRGGQRRGPMAEYTYMDRNLETEWLRGLLDV